MINVPESSFYCLFVGNLEDEWSKLLRSTLKSLYENAEYLDSLRLLIPAMYVKLEEEEHQEEQPQEEDDDDDDGTAMKIDEEGTKSYPILFPTIHFLD